MPFDPGNFSMPIAPACNSCKHLIIDVDSPIMACKAFPAGIPDAILDGDDDHKLPVRGDNGIQYEAE